MPNIEHSVITDPNIHEPKGITSATASQVYVANGAGSGVWQNKNSGIVLTEEIGLAGRDYTAQNPTLVDTPLQVTFGAAQGSMSDPVMIDAAGAITFNEAGRYAVTFTFSFGRTGGAGTSEVLLRFLTDGVESFSFHTKLDSADITIPIQFVGDTQVTAGSVTTVEIMRDSTGNNSGGLLPFTPALGTWGPSPSASVYISKTSAA